MAAEDLVEAGQLQQFPEVGADLDHRRPVPPILH